MPSILFRSLSAVLLVGLVGWMGVAVEASSEGQGSGQDAGSQASGADSVAGAATSAGQNAIEQQATAQKADVTTGAASDPAYKVETKKSGSSVIQRESPGVTGADVAGGKPASPAGGGNDSGSGDSGSEDSGDQASGSQAYAEVDSSPKPLTPEEALAAQAARAEQVLRDYIAVDTVNPPGNEIAGARYIADLLSDAGIEAKVLESSDGRGNVYAKIEGSGEGGLVLLSHLDVVPADPAHWTHPPMAGEVHDGELFGRGALDCKGVGTVQALAFLSVHQMKLPLERDLILLATAGEETGGAAGAGWIVEEHPELFEGVEFVVNEGAFLERRDDGRMLYNLTAAEKGPCWFRVTASGEPGHGSRPQKETAVTRLVAALDSLQKWERPWEVVPTVAGYFAGYAAFDEGRARELRRLPKALEDPAFYEWFTSDSSWSAMIRDTLMPTVLTGSSKTNIVPGVASAEIDSRLLPGHDCSDFLSSVTERIGNEHVRVERLEVGFPSSSSRLDNDFTRAVEKLASEEDQPAIVLPGLLTGFTDSHYFREHGMEAYGFVPLVASSEQRRSLHAPNERVSVDELGPGVRRMVRLIELLNSGEKG